jgi:syntaxin 18
LTPQQRSSILAAHHGAIIWFLNAELLKISERQREMQEERGKIRDERGKSLGGMVAKEVVSSNGDAKGSNLWRTSNTPINLTIPYKPATTKSPSETDDPLATDASLQLSQAQIQQFSSENTEMLESMQTTLNTVLQAERSLLEISQLQTTLISHLASQTETIERLYDDANDAIGSVEQANTQLKEAKRSGRDARFFLLVFLIGASMALLFLDWYSS